MSTALVPVNQPAALDAAYTPRTIDEAKALAVSFAKSGLLSRQVDSPEKAFTIMAAGAEIGLSPMAALRGIYIVEGRPTLSADTMVARIKSSPACIVWQLIRSDLDGATYRTHRKGEHAVEMSFTQADAKRAGLWGKAGPWTQYPDKMLRHRAASNLAREVYPDLLAGIYTPDEVDDALPIAATVVDPMTRDAAGGNASSGNGAPSPAKRAPKADPAPEIVAAAIDWPTRIAAAADLDALRAVAAEAARAQMPDDVRATATAAFKARKDALSEPARVAATGEVVERQVGEEG